MVAGENTSKGMDGHLPPAKVRAGAGHSVASVRGCCSSLICGGHTDKL